MVNLLNEIAEMDKEIQANEAALTQAADTPPATPPDQDTSVDAEAPAPQSDTVSDAVDRDTATATPDTATTQTPDAAKLQAQYQSLQGKYNAEIQPLHDQVASLRRENDQLRPLAEMAAQVQTELRELRTQIEARDAERRQAADANLSPAERFKRYGLTDADIEEYGERMPELVERVAKPLAEEATARVRQELQEATDERFQRMDAAESQKARNAFLETVHSAPEVQQLNYDTGFHEWLDQVDPIFGGTYRQALTAAEQACDASRVLKIFKAYSPVSAPKPEQPPVRDQAAPSGRPTTPDKPAASKPQRLSSADYGQRLARIEHGDYDHDPVRKAKELAFLDGMMDKGLVE